MTLTPKQIRKLVEIAFVLEPILEKKDCTTRYKDLKGKSLYDFCISGINAGDVIEDYATQLIEHNSTSMFSHYPKTVSVSNAYKTKKFINVGLLEFMFVTIRTRMEMTNLKNIEEIYIKTLKNTDKKDVLDNLSGFRVAIKTSKKKNKIEEAKENYEKFSQAANVYELYRLVRNYFTDQNSSGYQTSEEYLRGFPTVATYIREINEKKGLIQSLETTYNTLHKENPNTKVGILADLCAASIFLYLSFQNPDTYAIR